ncbi:DUF4328 domain-containing protein [Streptomyces sp. NPDC058373]|uniref:DUF4328 domain-containing protein n=1 Tax=Streptomyces sp. NPDC058373 TaxID=3346465 RepID=UPI00364BED0A
MLCLRCRTNGAVLPSPHCTLCADAHRLDGRTHLDGRRPVPVSGDAVLRSPAGFGWAVVTLFALVGLADLAGAVLDLRMAGLVDSVTGGDWAAEERWAETEDVSVWLATFWGPAYLASIVLFLLWFRRTRVNAEVFDPYGHTKARGWAIGAWFVPVVSLWFPRRIASETWHASVSPVDRRGTLLLNLWWGTFLLDTVLSNGSTRVLNRAEELEAIARGYRMVAFSEAFSVVHAVIAVLFVLALTRRQNARVHHPWPPAAPVPGSHAPEKV